MPRKQVKTFKRLLPGCFVLAGLIFLFAPQKLTDKVRFAFIDVFRRPLAVGRSISRSAPAVLLGKSEEAGGGRGPLDVVSGSKYRRLRNFHANTVLRLYQERQKVEELSRLRERTIWEGSNFVLADVITATVNGACAELLINRGTEDGLAEGQFVMGDHSIVGAISSVGSRVARVRLITDPASKVAVSIADVNVRCIMEGSGEYWCRVGLLAAKYKVEIGDTVWVRKKPGFLDTPMAAGTVAWCKRSKENPLLWDIEVSPACNIERLNKVTVIIMNPQEN